MSLIRPEPVQAWGATQVDRRLDPRDAAGRLLRGEEMLVVDTYGTGADILEALAGRFEGRLRERDHQRRRSAERQLREAGLRLLAPIRRHRVDLEGAGFIHLLGELYPELSDFALPLPQVQELHGASIRYAEGQHLAVLGRRVHPFYGVYAPTRTEHLELFATWLSGQRGEGRRAVDVGTGCGVLALMLARAGFQVLATDSNPNAIESVRRELGRGPERVELRCGDLFCDDLGPFARIVFNPPWTPGQVQGPLDAALYFEEGLFERFFDQALERLAPDGRVVLVFSNVMRLLTPDVPHPIDAELERGRFTLSQKLQRRIKRKGRKTRERVEVWELEKA